ncbi:MAG: type II toxin-antitoxin system HipA family toxin [Candidatus Marinimicrobia bacterium]|nr:type II toxin-antitoxin system HipA family toxin [Candidatus Neomarinimicrobiota bacterium]
MIETAWVKIWGETVGAVAWDNETGLASFEYDQNFIKLGWNLAPTKMPIASPRRVFSFPELRKARGSQNDTFKGLPGLLADVLPDKYGNQLMNIWLASEGRPQNSMNPVEQLSFIGTRGMGALEFEPSMQKQDNETFDIELQSLVNIAQRMLSTREKFSTSLHKTDEKAMMDILKIGTSAGGARPKAIISYNETTGEVKSGQAGAPPGFEHWLLKLDGVNDEQFGESHGWGRVEMAYYNMAIDCGLEMMPSKLIEENGRAHFMTKRFDREANNTKYHIQTLCAMQHYDFNEITSYSYEQLFQTLRELQIPYPQAEQLFRRMVFNVLAKNCDDHTKNFAFKLKKDGEWELAPAYDICYAYSPGHEWVSQQCLSVNGKRKGITNTDFLKVAKSMNIKRANPIIKEIHSVVNQWLGYADSADVNATLTTQIANALKLGH